MSSSDNHNVVNFVPGNQSTETVIGTNNPTAEHVQYAQELKPDDLNGLASDYWDQLAPQLIMIGRLKPYFVHAFEDYCIILARLKKAREYLDDADWVYVTQGRNGDQIKSRPEVAQLNDDWRKIRSLTGEFGLGPSSERVLTDKDQMGLFDDSSGLNNL